MKKYLLSFLLLSLPLSASDNLTIDQQNEEMDRVFGRIISSTKTLEVGLPHENLNQEMEKLFQEELNQKVSKIAVEAYQLINKNWSYSTCEPESSSIESCFWRFSSFEKESGEEVPTLIFMGQTVGNLPIAFRDATLNSAKVECVIAAKMVKNIVLYKILGEESFNLYIEQLLKKKRLKLTSRDFFHQLPYGVTREGKNVFQSTSEKKEGHFVYIVNISNYFDFFEEGASQGENLVCVGPDQYIGFGERFRKGPLTEEQIANSFYEELSTNAKFCEKYPTKDSYLTARAKHQEEIDKTAIYGYFNAKAIY